MTRLKVEQIRLDGGTQMRVGPRNPDALRDYKDAIQDGANLPPVIVFHDGQSYWLADGFHRWSAHRELDLRDIEADVREGSQRDAVLFSVGANASHGLRRTNADKRRAVETLLKDEEWGGWTDREVARRCGVSPDTVGRIRREVQPSLSESDSERSYTTKHGTQATMRTANIGQRPAPAPVANAGPQPQPAPAWIAEPEPDELDDAPHILAPQEPERVIQAEDLYIPFAGDEPKNAEENERIVREIHNALNRLLKQERHGRGALAVPDPYTRSVRSLAHLAREMLDDWLDDFSEKDSKTITIDALN